MTPSGVASSGWAVRAPRREGAAGVRIDLRWRVGVSGTLVLNIDGCRGELVFDPGACARTHPIVGSPRSTGLAARTQWVVEAIVVEPEQYELSIRQRADGDRISAATLVLEARPGAAAPVVLTSIPEAVGLRGGTYVLESAVFSR
jgi:hypothetical protein